MAAQNKELRQAVFAGTAGFLGWTLDAFDFFVAVFLVNTLAAQFHVPVSKIIFTTFATLAMGPVGAGRLRDSGNCFAGGGRVARSGTEGAPLCQTRGAWRWVAFADEAWPTL